MTKMGLMNATCGNMNTNIVSRKKRKASARKEMMIEPVFVDLSCTSRYNMIRMHHNILKSIEISLSHADNLPVLACASHCYHR